MQFMVLYRASDGTEAGAALPFAGMHALAPSTGAVRMHIEAGRSTIVDGPFAPDEMIAGFSVIDAESREDAIAQVRAWPLPDGTDELQLEIRQSGCPGGCASIEAVAPAHPQGKRFAVLLRSSPDLENEVPVPQHKLDTLDAHNAREAKAGVLVSGDGLRSMASGARIKLAPGFSAVMDGPFTEIKELIAGYWMVQVPSLEEAIAWARRNPYPTGPDVDVEIREVLPPPAQPFTAEQRQAEQGMREHQLDLAMRAELAGR